MASDKTPGSDPLELVTQANQRGRTGMVIGWEHIPWWGIIVLLVGVIVGYSVLTSTRYIDAIYFIFDMPWNKDARGKMKVKDDGVWAFTVKPPLEAGTYTFYVEYFDSEGNTIGQSDSYHIQVADDATKQVLEPLTPSTTPLKIHTSTPSLTGIAPAKSTVVLYDDFSDNVGRIIRRAVFANGVLLTIRVTLIAFVAALILGLLFGLMRVANGSPDLAVGVGKRLLIGVVFIALGWLISPQWRGVTPLIIMALLIEAFMFLLPAMPYTFSTLYVEIVRGVPMLVIILYMGFAITPFVRKATGDAVDLRGLPAAVIGLAFGYGAYLAEVFRAGIQSISRGQMEAARSLGMNYFQAMRYIILPQAIRVILPPLGNDFIAMLKDSSLISVIALPEVLQQGRLWISRNFRAFEGFNSVALMYLVMTLLLSLLVRYIERRSKLPGH